jgi:transcriptional antiterminator NusG
VLDQNEQAEVVETDQDVVADPEEHPVASEADEVVSETEAPAAAEESDEDEGVEGVAAEALPINRQDGLGALVRAVEEAEAELSEEDAEASDAADGDDVAAVPGLESEAEVGVGAEIDAGGEVSADVEVVSEPVPVAPAPAPPAEDDGVVEMKSGRKVVTAKKFFPGYLLIRMAMNEDLWHVVKNTPRVTGFVGAGRKPIPLPQDEVDKIVNRMEESVEAPKPKFQFSKNETVRIIDGPFTNFTGKVEEVDARRSTLKVMVSIFGRNTPVELDFFQVEKV